VQHDHVQVQQEYGVVQHFHASCCEQNLHLPRYLQKADWVMGVDFHHQEVEDHHHPQTINQIGLQNIIDNRP
jgi:hypothetical protein